MHLRKSFTGHLFLDDVTYFCNFSLGGKLLLNRIFLTKICSFQSNYNLDHKSYLLNKG